MDFLTPTQLEDFLTPADKSLFDSMGQVTGRRAAMAVQVSDEVSGYIGARVPSHVPPSIVFHAFSIARFRLRQDKASEQMAAAHDIAVKFFREIQAGRYALPLADDPDTPEDESAGPSGVWFTSKPLLLGTPWFGQLNSPVARRPRCSGGHRAGREQRPDSPRYRLQRAGC